MMEQDSILVKLDGIIQSAIISAEAAKQLAKRMHAVRCVALTADQIIGTLKKMPPKEHPRGWPFIKRYWRRPAGMRKKRAGLLLKMGFAAASASMQIAIISAQPTPKFKPGTTIK